MDLLHRVGEELGRYRLDALLGRGGMGEVWQASRIELEYSEPAEAEGPFALKIPLEPALARVLRHEDRLLRRLDHPFIVKEIELVRDHEPPFLVMELASGESARALLRSRGALPAEIALVIFSRVLEAIAHAHSRGVVHRDLKPENVIVEPTNLSVKITDFGIGALNEEALALLLSKSVISLGADGASGTLEYMPPEQRKGGAVADPRLDVYALGVFLYELLTGELPLGAFRLPTEVDRGLPTTLDRVIERALAPRAANRFADASELASHLRAGLKREGFSLEPRRAAHSGAAETPAPAAPPPSPRAASLSSTPPPPTSPIEVPATPARPFVSPGWFQDGLLPVALVSCGPAANGPRNLRARTTFDASVSAYSTRLELTLARELYTAGEEVEGTIVLGLAEGSSARSVRFRARAFVRLARERRTARALLPDLHLAGERPRGLLWDEEAVLAGPPGPLSLGLRLQDALQAFSVASKLPVPYGRTEIRFALELPADVPPSYAGELFSVSHLLLARLDVPFGVDQDATAPLIVRAAGEPRERSGPRERAAAGPRDVWAVLTGSSAERLELKFGYDEPAGAPPVKEARVILVRKEELIRPGKREVARTVLSRGLVAVHAADRANRLAIESNTAEDVVSFDVALPGEPGALGLVRTNLEIHLYDGSGNVAGRTTLGLVRG